MGESRWIVTSRRKVHRRHSKCADRIAFPAAWLPSEAKPSDKPCEKPECLWGYLPDALDEMEARR